MPNIRLWKYIIKKTTQPTVFWVPSSRWALTKTFSLNIKNDMILYLKYDKLRLGKRSFKLTNICVINGTITRRDFGSLCLHRPEMMPLTELVYMFVDLFLDSNIDQMVKNPRTCSVCISPAGFAPRSRCGWFIDIPGSSLITAVHQQCVGNTSLWWESQPVLLTYIIATVSAAPKGKCDNGWQDIHLYNTG